MDPIELARLLRAAEAAAADGFSEADIDADIKNATRGEFNSLAELRQVVKLPGSFVRDMARSAIQGATFGFGDELAGVGAAIIPGGRGYAEARDASRANLERIRAEHPVASTVAEIAGSALAPGVGFARSGGLAALRGGQILGAVGRGALAGGTAAGLYAAGEAEGNIAERAQQAALPGLLGAAIGGGLAAAAPVATRTTAAVRAARNPMTRDALAEELAKRAGVPRGELSSAVEAAKARVKQISQTAFKPLDEAFAAVDDPVIMEALQNPRAMQAARHVMRADLQKRPPSFRELQAIRQRMLSKAESLRHAKDNFVAREWSTAADELSVAMQQRIPGFAEANAQYSAALAGMDAFEQGVQAFRRLRPEQIRAALAKLPDDIARENFRNGMVALFYDQLSKQGGPVTPKLIAKFESAGMRARLRELFRTQKDFDRFMEHLRKYNRAIVDADKLKPISKFAAGLGIGLGATSVGRGIFDLFN